jgi:fucokinase
VLDPAANGGRTLLHYTGLTRRAKSLLDHVVGRYLDRDRATIATLDQVRALPVAMAEAMVRRDLPAFGRCVAMAWEQNKRLDPDSTNAAVEAILKRVQPYVHGAKLLGAGGGGFLPMVGKTRRDAAAARAALERDPPNDWARFCSFSIDKAGLLAETCPQAAHELA